MKRILSILLALTMILSLSVCAFAAGSPDSRHVHEPDVYDVPAVVPAPIGARADRDELLRKIPMTEGVSVEDGVAENDKVVLSRLIDAPDDVKALARNIISQMENDGYTINSGFAAWSEQGTISKGIIKITVSSVPEGYGIYVNGVLVEDPEMHDGLYFIEVDLPAIITIARK